MTKRDFEKKFKLIFPGAYSGIEKEKIILANKIKELNPKSEFIRVSFKMKSTAAYALFGKGKEETFTGVARIIGCGIVHFFKTVKGGNPLNIHSVAIEDIMQEPFTKTDKLKWNL